MDIELDPSRYSIGNDVLSVSHLSKAFGGSSFHWHRSIRSAGTGCLVGNNGAGRNNDFKGINDIPACHPVNQARL